MASSPFLEAMGNRIYKRRKEMHMTQEQLAEQMGVSFQTISCIELGKKAIRPDNLVNLCNCLSVTADYILTGQRSEAQMCDLVDSLSMLTPEQYNCVKTMIQLFNEKQ